MTTFLFERIHFFACRKRAQRKHSATKLELITESSSGRPTPPILQRINSINAAGSTVCRATRHKNGGVKGK